MHDLHRPRPGRGLHGAHVRHGARPYDPASAPPHADIDPPTRSWTHDVAENPHSGRPRSGTLSAQRQPLGHEDPQVTNLPPPTRSTCDQSRVLVDLLEAAAGPADPLPSTEAW